jgi:ATP-binding cassette subfamily F protein uup
MPVNVLVLDEPTNDLDVESLQLLEQLLLEFDGTILLVSHDREFLDNVVTSSVVFEGDGAVAEYVGGYTDWLRQRAQPKAAASELKTGASESKATVNKAPVAAATTQPAAKKSKLSYKLQRELDELPKKIEALERQVAELNARAASDDFYRLEAAQVTAHLQQIASAQLALETAYARWVELSEG